MAAFGRHVLSLSRIVQRSCVSITCQRHLLSADVLGIEGYRRQRLVISDRLGNLRGNFLLRMNENLSKEDGRAFTEDIKTLLHIADSDTEVQMLIALIRRQIAFGEDHSETDITRFKFGPVLMRLLHVTHNADTALTLFKDEKLHSLFSNVTSHMLLMDLLYESHRYEDAVNVFSSVRSGLASPHPFPIDCTTLVLASLYKMNTAEALTQTLSIIKDLNAADVKLTSRAVGFAASLALNQDQPSTALELCSHISSVKVISVQNLKIISYARLNRPEDTLPYFRQLLQDDRPFVNMKLRIFNETISEVEKAIEQSDKKELQHELHSIKQGLLSGGLIREDTLKDYVEGPIFRNVHPRNSFKNRPKAPIDGARSRGPGFKPGYRQFQQDQNYGGW